MKWKYDLSATIRKWQERLAPFADQEIGGTCHPDLTYIHMAECQWSTYQQAAASVSPPEFSWKCLAYASFAKFFSWIEMSASSRNESKAIGNGDKAHTHSRKDLLNIFTALNHISPQTRQVFDNHTGHLCQLGCHSSFERIPGAQS